MTEVIRRSAELAATSLPWPGSGGDPRDGSRRAALSETSVDLIPLRDPPSAEAARPLFDPGDTAVDLVAVPDACDGAHAGYFAEGLGETARRLADPRRLAALKRSVGAAYAEAAVVVTAAMVWLLLMTALDWWELAATALAVAAAIVRCARRARAGAAVRWQPRHDRRGTRRGTQRGVRTGPGAASGSDAGRGETGRGGVRPVHE